MPNATQPKRGKALPATNLSSCQKRGGRCAKRSLECRREQENHSQKVCNANQIFQLYQGIDISTKKRSTKMCVRGLGTRNRLLRYRICVPCSKRLPGVRDASSEALGAQNRLLRYGRDNRCQKQASVVRDASSKARRTADSTDCGQPPAALDAFQRRPCQKQHLPTGRIFRGGRAKSSPLPHWTQLQCAKRLPLSLFPTFPHQYITRLCFLVPGHP